MAMTPLSSNENGSEIMAEINITPLTDIFLVLLIIFMITSSAMIESGWQGQLAQGSSHTIRSAWNHGHLDPQARNLCESEKGHRGKLRTDFESSVECKP